MAKPKKTHPWVRADRAGYAAREAIARKNGRATVGGTRHKTLDRKSIDFLSKVCTRGD